MVLSTARVIQHFGCAWPLAYCAFPQSPRHAPDLHEPFKVQISGGLCDSGPSPSSNPEIMIDSNGTDSFVVTSILVKRALMNPVDFSFFSVNTVQIDGTSFDTRTGTLFGPLGGHSPKPPGRRLLRHPPAPSGSAPARRGVRRSGLHRGAGHRGVSASPVRGAVGELDHRARGGGPKAGVRRRRTRIGAPRAEGVQETRSADGDTPASAQGKERVAKDRG